MTHTNSRRQMIRSLVGGSLLFPGIVSELFAADGGSATSPAIDPLSPKLPHFPAKAKRVIFLYMSGGVSHADSFDPKPRLLADAGKTVTPPASPDPTKLLKKTMYLKAPQWQAKPHGRSGIAVSELFPNVAECVDDLCLIRSMKGDHNNHAEATLGIHTGSVTLTRPSIGSWVSYGLGTVNRNLPSFVVLAPQLPYAGGQVWGADFLPPCHQGTRVGLNHERLTYRHAGRDSRLTDVSGSAVKEVLA